MTLVVFSHYKSSLVQQPHLWLVGHSARDSARLQQDLKRHIAAVEPLIGLAFNSFFMIAGVDDHYLPVFWWRLFEVTAINAILLYVTFYSSIGALMDSLFSGNLATGRLGAESWWFVSIVLLKAVTITSKSLKLPTWLVPCVSLIVHFLSFGDLLPWPLQRSPLHRLYRGPMKHLVRRLPLAQAFVTPWLLLYAVAPCFLPQGFPARLPFDGGTAEVHSAHKEPAPHAITRRWRVRGSRFLWATSLPALIYALTALEGGPSGLIAHMRIPYACIAPGLSANECARRLLDSPMWEHWNAQAALRDAAACFVSAVVVIGIASWVPRRSTAFVTIGNNSLFVLLTHMSVLFAVEPTLLQLARYYCEAPTAIVGTVVFEPWLCALNTQSWMAFV